MEGSDLDLASGVYANQGKFIQMTSVSINFSERVFNVPTNKKTFIGTHLYKNKSRRPEAVCRADENFPLL